jgi:3-hydroxybutyryl-CoA dehydrogenase
MSKKYEIAVIGAGQMGSGIAQNSAQSGYKVNLYDSLPGAAEKAKAKISTAIDKLLQKSKISETDAKSAKDNISICNKINDLKSCHLVIEAIIEKEDVKIKAFKEIAEVVASDCILASNTSSISISKMAEALPHPQNFIGIHFMNPVPVMKLVELIRARQTSDETYQKAKEFSESLGKTTVLALDSAGFIINRILCPMLNEAIFLLEAGVKKEDIDTGMKLGTNQPMGPLELADFVGLDTLLFIMQTLEKDLKDKKYSPCPLLIEYVKGKKLGRKTGEGFYKY